MIHPHPSEVGIDHNLIIQVSAEDGKVIWKVEAAFKLDLGDDNEPGETPVLPIIIDFGNPVLTVPHVGGYSIDILIDQQHKDSLSFFAKIR